MSDVAASAPSLDRAAFSDWLALGDDSIWATRDAGQLPYPPDGHELCGQVEYGSFWFAHRNRLAVVVERYPSGGVLFDVGGGNGFVTLGLQGAKVAGVLMESDPVGAANARARGCATWCARRYRTPGSGRGRFRRPGCSTCWSTSRCRRIPPHYAVGARPRRAPLPDGAGVPSALVAQ